MTKLGAGRLLEEALRVLGATLEECGRLPALASMLQRGRLYKRLGPERCAALLPLAHRIPVAPDPDPSWYGKLVGVQAIDPGEAHLFAVAAADESVLLLTADKRSLEAARGVPGLCDALRGRIVSLEAILRVLCDELGAAFVTERLQSALDLDTMFSACFRTTNGHEGLVSYQNDLGARVGEALLWGNELWSSTPHTTSRS